MSDAIFGQPWHGRLTPSGLMLAGETLKTTMAGTDAAGAPKTFNYVWSGNTVSGATFYHRVPGLPAPATPAALTAIGGEFKNDCILFGDAKRYSPFAGSSGLSGVKWPHYGSDGVWRKMQIVVTAEAAQSHSVKIYREGRFLALNAGDTNESTLIATLTLEHTAPVGYAAPIFPAPDVRYDGRQIVVTRRDTWANPTDPADGAQMVIKPWNNATQRGIVAAWKIDISADCTSATATRVWQVEATVSGTSNNRTYIESTNVFYENGAFWESYEGVRQGQYDSHCTIKRLIGAAYSPEGNLVLLEYTHHSEMTGVAHSVSGTVFMSFSNTPVPVPSPRPPDTAPGGSYFASHSPSHPYTETALPSGTTFSNPVNAIVDGGDTTQAALFTAPLNPAAYALPVTNNVFDFQNGTVSKARFGPGGSDVSDSTLSPRYASYNPRTNLVYTSSTPIGFV